MCPLVISLQPRLELDTDRDDKQTKPVSNGIKPSVLDLSEPVKPVFAPVFLANSSQPCQCSACVGAMAANITEVTTAFVCGLQCLEH